MASFAGIWGQLAVLSETASWGSAADLATAADGFPDGGTVSVRAGGGGQPQSVAIAQPGVPRRIVAIGGTTTAAQWFLNLAATQVMIPTGAGPGSGQVAGFFGVLANAIWGSIPIDLPLVFTGHSLGGAVAQVLLAFAVEAGLNADALVFGAPRVGDADFAAFVGGRTTQVWIVGDPIPLVPVGSTIQGTWTHAGQTLTVNPQVCPVGRSTPPAWTPRIHSHFVSEYIRWLSQCTDPAINAQPAQLLPPGLNAQVARAALVLGC